MKYVVQYIAPVVYDFVDKKTGKQVSGITRKAVMTRENDDKQIIALEVVKIAPDSKIRVGDSGGTPLYDKFGRLYGFG